MILNDIYQKSKKKYETLLIPLKYKYVKHYKLNKYTYVTVKCLMCGSVFDVESSNIHEGKSKCNQCHINTYHTICKTNNCKYLKHYIKNKHTYITVKCLICGNVFNVRSDRVYKKRLACNQCYKSKWNQNGSVYAFTFNKQLNTYCKIGYANNPKNRLKKLKITYPCNIHILDEFDTLTLCHQLEHTLHKKLRKYNLKPIIASKFTNGISRRRKGNICVYKPPGITEWFMFENMNENNVIKLIKTLM